MSIGSTRRLSALPLGLLLVATLDGCSLIRHGASRYPAADIDAIYADAVNNPQRNPVILIHGFTGAKLVRTADGATVWGAFFAEDAPLPSKAEGLRAIALDIDGLPSPIQSHNLISIDDDSQADELLEHARAGAFGARINFEVYAAMVEMVERAGYGPCGGVDSLTSKTERPACLTFFYDWRQDIVGNAISLGRFIEEAHQRLEMNEPPRAGNDDPPIKFDIVAHSLGGLVTRYLLRYGPRDVLDESEPPVTWAGTERISRAILIATPNYGSMEALKEMLTGVKYPVFKYEQTLLATFVSLYQMLPRESHDLWLDQRGDPTTVDFMSAEVWRRNNWGPFAPKQDRHLQVLYPSAASAQERSDRIAEFMDAAFERAQRFMAVMDRHPDTRSPTPLYLFASDASPTLARAVVNHTDDGIRFDFKAGRKIELKSPGDGRVTRASAVANDRLAGGPPGWLQTPIGWTQNIFLTDSHMSMLSNPTFQNNLLHLLLDIPTQVNPGRP